MCHRDDTSFAPDRGDLTEQVSVTGADGEALPGVMQRSRTGGMAPVLLLTDIYGPIPFYVGLAGALADAGHDTLVVDFLHRAGPLERHDRDVALARARALDQHLALADLHRACDWLSAAVAERFSMPADELAPAGRIGLLGFCLGGTLALNLAAERHDTAVVSFYGFPAGVPGRNALTPPTELVDDIDAPVLAFWGEEDYMDMTEVRAFCAAMAQADDRFRSHIFPGVGHSFLGGLSDGEDTAARSWQSTLTFLGEHLDVPQRAAVA